MNRSINNPATSVSKETRSYVRLPLQRINFILMAISGLMIVVGFLLMAGSSSTPTEFNPEIFSARRVVVGPTIAFLGFLFMGFAIMWSPSKKASDQNTTSAPDQAEND